MCHSNMIQLTAETQKASATHRLAGLPILLLVTALGACGSNQQPTTTTGSAAVAEDFISAFYSLQPSELRALLIPGEDAERALYYQGWAKGADYQIQTRRPCVARSSEPEQAKPASSTPKQATTQGAEAEQWTCRITVTDNFGKTLGYTATDTFTLTVANDMVAAVTFEGDDPPIFTQLQAWIATEQPEVMSGPCKDLFNGGTTPGDCARAVVAAAKEFVTQ